MRLATLIISLVLSLGLFIQSCAVAVGGSISEDLSTAAADRREAEDLAGGGGIGIFAALLWLVAAAFVMNKPKISMWLFVVAGLFCLIGGATGFSDLFIWAVVSFAFALMAWRGTKEKEKKALEEQERYQADVQAAASAQQLQQRPPGQS